MKTMAFGTGVFAIYSMFAWATTALGQESKQDGDSTALKQRRLEIMRKRINSLQVIGADGNACEFSKSPLLRYSDQERSVVDACLWSIGKSGRPCGIVVLEVYRGTSIQYEFTAAAELPKSVQGDSWRWEPEDSDFTWVRIPDQASPEDARVARRTQVPEIATKFRAKEEFRGRTYDLELMRQPILWYADKAKGVLDAAAFVFAHGTNAEILMFIEAQTSDAGKTKWVAGFSRMGSAALNVTFAEKEFWSRPTYYGNPKRTYFYRLEQLTEDEQGAF